LVGPASQGWPEVTLPEHCYTCGERRIREDGSIGHYERCEERQVDLARQPWLAVAEASAPSHAVPPEVAMVKAQRPW
jgi:hypothetical protein